MEAKRLYKTARIATDRLPMGFKQGDIVAVKWYCHALHLNVSRDVFKVTAITGEVSLLYEMALCDFVL